MCKGFTQEDVAFNNDYAYLHIDSHGYSSIRGQSIISTNNKYPF